VPETSINWPDGITTGSFLRDYWQQQPLLVRQAFPGFISPLSPDDLAGLALEEDIHSRLILQQRHADRSTQDQWHLRQGPFSEQELTELPPADWSLLVSDIEKHLHGFQTYLEPFRFIPDWRIDDLMISYAPRGASVGAHSDEYDVFLLQAAGYRRWQISTDAAADPDYLPDTELRILQHFKPTEDWTLAPGDLLYLPPGIPHHGISMDNDCMTWSVGFRSPSVAALVGDITEQLLSDEQLRYRDHPLDAHTRRGEIDTVTLAHIRQLWDDALAADSAVFAQAVGRVLSRRQDSLNNAGVTVSSKIGLAECITGRAGASRLAFISNPESTTLFADGEAHSVSSRLAETLCASFEWPAGKLLSLCETDNDRLCLEQLWNHGILCCQADTE